MNATLNMSESLDKPDVLLADFFDRVSLAGFQESRLLPITVWCDAYTGPLFSLCHNPSGCM